MITDKNFLGRNGFIWFTGVVEDRLDPQYIGRVRVRCIGFHTQDKTKLPTADLPWATCLLPTTAAGISGLGDSPSSLVEGSWVIGYFRDGDTCQEPIVLGSLPGRPSELASTSKGFYDPNGVYPKYKDEVDTNRLAVNLKNSDGEELNPHLSLTLRRSTRTTGWQQRMSILSQLPMVQIYWVLMVIRGINRQFHMRPVIHTTRFTKLKVVI